MGLICENEFCIYQNQGGCILENVQLDIKGNCTECIYIDIEKGALNNLKEKLLKQMIDFEM